MLKNAVVPRRVMDENNVRKFLRHKFGDKKKKNKYPNFFLKIPFIKVTFSKLSYHAEICVCKFKTDINLITRIQFLSE